MRKPPKMTKADRRQALVDDLAWIEKGRAKTKPDTGDRKHFLRRPL